jgi:integrase
MVQIFRKTITRYKYQGRVIPAEEARQLQAIGVHVEKVTELTKKYYIRIRVGGRVRDVPGHTDRDATIAKAAKLIRQSELEDAGVLLPADRHATEPWEPHLDEYLTNMRYHRCTKGHIRTSRYRITTLLQLAGARRLCDITADRILAAITELRRQGLSIQTTNHYLANLKAFCNWLVREDKMLANPLVKIKKQNPETDIRRKRDPFTEDELRKLILVTEASNVTRCGLAGPDRAALYLLAASTGLRASELASLTAANLRLDATPPVVVVQASYTKNRQQATQPLPPETADYLRRWLGRRRSSTKKLFPGRWTPNAVRMLAQDCRQAGIPTETDSGRRDFHSLRYFYATMLAKQGANLQTAQALMRHSDPKLTSRIYTRLGITDLAAVVSRIQLLPPAAPHLPESVPG